jgi:hypothetical protein
MGNNMTDYKNTVFAPILVEISKMFQVNYQKMTGITAAVSKDATLGEQQKTYSTSMGLNGHFKLDDGQKIPIKGNAVLCWGLDGYVKMAGKFLGEEYTEYCSDIEDIGMEILNTAIGNSKNPLSEKKIFIEMSLPNSIVGVQELTDLGNKAMAAKIFFDSEYGKILLIVSCIIE